MNATVAYTLGRFVWRELFTKDVAAAKRFYSTMFGWTWEDRPMGPGWSYTIWKIGDTQVGGMMDIANMPAGDAGFEPQWLTYVSVANVDKAAETAVAAGGQLLGGCHDISGVGRFAPVQDPQGARLNLFRSASGDPEDTMPGLHDFCWENLSTSDVPKAAEFYKKVVGWSTSQMGDATLFDRQGPTEPIGVASTGPVPSNRAPQWYTFVAVETVDAALAKAQELGAKLVIGRMEVPDVGAFATFEDPTGAAICVFESIVR
jgi:predicted enzyme related to lactoylglutathione lyase